MGPREKPHAVDAAEEIAVNANLRYDADSERIARVIPSTPLYVPSYELIEPKAREANLNIGVLCPPQ